MNNEQQKLLERVNLVPDLLGGKPTIRGQRFLVSDVLELLSTGMSEEEILEQHPVLQKTGHPGCPFVCITKNEKYCSDPCCLKLGKFGLILKYSQS
jgi:uncharacterized protein (DUF433 family)